MLPIIQTLAAQGLTLLANAVLAKGKQEVEERLGIVLKNDPSPADLADYRRAEMAHEVYLTEAALRKEQQSIEAEKTAQDNVTKRWQSDAMSDSQLSKNVRPLILIYLTLAITVLAGLPIVVDPAWIELLKVSYVTVLTAYFVGRTVEKRETLK